MSVTVSQQQNFVGGEWVDAVEGGTMEVLNPASGETIADVPRGTQADVDRAVESVGQTTNRNVCQPSAPRSIEASTIDGEVRRRRARTLL